MPKPKPAYRLVIPLTKRPEPISKDRLKMINGLWEILRVLIEEANADLLKGAGYGDTNWRLVVHPNEYPPPIIVMNEPG